MRRPGASGARPVVTGRALVLGGVLVLLVVLLAAPVHRYLASRSEVQHTAQRLADDRAARTALRAQKARWSDPGYIERQARTRLQFAMPGDTVYIVVDKGQRSDIERSAGTTSKAAPGPAWNTRLWDSVRAAGT
jgi:cell division protein FtsB